MIDYNEKFNLSLVKVHLKTGRHHQIRVQFATRGYPLIGDNRYGHDNNKEIGLFAYQLTFIHPVKKDKMTFTYLPINKPFSLFDLKNDLTN